jgi:hypothetical protein
MTTTSSAGIIEIRDRCLVASTRSIDDYHRDFLKDQFLTSLEGRTWKEREEAILDFARWLGFHRTG